jgi:hypothetical protein
MKMSDSLKNVTCRNHLQECLLENDVLNVMRQWLEPLPDGSLPNIKIRQGFLKILTKVRTLLSLTIYFFDLVLHFQSCDERVVF